MVINDEKIKQIIKENGKEKHKIKKVLLSFLFGGIIGLFGEAIYVLFSQVFFVNHEDAIIYSDSVIIVISFLLTGFGVFDKVAQIAHSGVLIPISGFANSITSSAIEGKTEGLVFGIGGKMFSLIGCVFTYGIVSSIVLGFIYYLMQVLK